MARRRFFVPEVRSGKATLEGDDAEHLVRVLRVEAGQRFEISDNERVWLAEVELARKKEVVFRTLEDVPVRPATARLLLLAALIKYDHLEWTLEKATELGAAAIHLVKAERSEKGLDLAAPKRMVRWRRILLEASQQCRRDRLPELHEPVPLKHALQTAATVRLRLEEETAPPILHHLPPLEPAHSVALLVGPEGGWADRERNDALDAGWQPVSLAPLILRAETAAIAGLAVVQARLTQ